MRTALANSRIALVLIAIIIGYLVFSDRIYPHLFRLLTPWLDILTALPYLLSGVIVLIGWHFHYSKPIWVALIISFIAFCAQTALYYQGLFTLTMLSLLALWLLMISTFDDKPILSRGALFQLGCLVLPIALCALAYSQYPNQYLAGLTYDPTGLPSIIPALPYSVVVLGVQAVALTGLLWSCLRYRQQQDLHLLITLGLLSWAIYGPLRPLEITLALNLLLVAWLLAVLIHGHNLAYQDELTGLPGRRALNQALSLLSKRSVVAMLDVDHFKKFNDTYGHDVGDQVLRMVASRLRGVKGGKAYRYGGEEFTILFPNTSIEVARAAAEEVRQAVEQSSLQLRGKYRPKNTKKGAKLRGSGPSKETRAVSVTISIGLAENDTDKPIKVADQKLYDAKQLGRNQVCI